MSELTTKILRGIRDEIRGLREEGRKTSEDIRGLREEGRKTNERLQRLERRQVETETRLATELVAVVGAIHELKDAVLEDRQLRATVSDHEQRISALERAR